jgi:hypothetical protein
MVHNNCVWTNSVMHRSHVIRGSLLKDPSLNLRSFGRRTLLAPCAMPPRRTRALRCADVRRDVVDRQREAAAFSSHASDNDAIMVDASGAVAVVNDSSGTTTAAAMETPSHAAAPRDDNGDTPPLPLPLLPPVEPVLAHAPPCILHARDCHVQRVKGDGSCAYPAVVCAAAARAGVVLTEDEERDEAQRLRLKVAECLRQHAHEMSRFVGDVDAYARAAAAPTAWADELDC